MGNRTSQVVTATAIILAGGAVESQATQIISTPLSTILNNGGTYSGSFDISSFLSNGGQQFALLDATVQVQGYSPYDPTTQYVAGYYSYVSGTYSYTCGWFDTCYGPIYSYAPYYAFADFTLDSLSVNTGTGSGSGNGQSGYYGNILATAVLTPADLLQGTNNGLVHFTINAVTNGGIDLTNATLAFDLTQVTSAGTTDVPEPMTWTTLAAGLGVTGLLARKRRKRNAQ